MEAPYEWIQDPYLATLNNTNSKRLKIYNNAVVVFPERDRYDLTRFKQTGFYQ